MTEAELMSRLEGDLGPLASDAQWSTTAGTGQPQGSYSDPIADAKDGANVAGNLADVTESATLVLVRRLALLGCLERLELHAGADGGEHRQ